LKIKRKIFAFFILLFFASNNLFYAKIDSLNTSTDYAFAEKNYFKIKFDSLLQSKGLSNTKFSFALLSLDDDKFLYQKNGDVFVKPASVTKLITSFAAFSLLGKDYKIATNLYTNDNNISNGEINGNIYIRGMGDCLLSLSDLDELVRQISNLGIKKINGNIIADGNLFDDENNRFKYSGDDDEVEPVALITALSIERNMFKIFINTNVQNNEPKIQVFPNADNVTLQSNINIITKKVFKRASSNHQVFNQKKKDPKSKIKNTKELRNPKYNKIKAKETKHNNTKTNINKLSAHSKLDANGNQIIYLNGNLSGNTSYSIQEFNLSPELTVASLLKKRLESNCITVSGKILKQTRSTKLDYSNLSQIATVSRNLSSFITEMNKNSDNYIAENLFKLNGALYHKDSVLSRSSRLLIDSLVKPFNSLNETIQIYDGSGLSRRNRLNATIMVNLLKSVTTKPFFQEFLNSLAIGGVDGTIAKRFKNTVAEQSVFAKTGTHKDVSSLAGFARNIDGKVYIFAFFFNGPNIGVYKTIETEAVKFLTGFSKNNL
jgi:D-alanyl-D-alanine carboxypeptidase/D-alanyl-D-alanine-endopeptidase (penicillin-binding protein 4)